MKELDLTKILKVGDKVWSPVIGECIVKAINETDNHFEILVETPDKMHDTWYTKDGKYFTYSPECTLFPSKDHRVWDDEAISIIRPRWRANQNGRYYFIKSSGMITSEIDLHTAADFGRYKLGNYFKTELEAVTALKKIKETFNNIHNGNN